MIRLFLSASIPLPGRNPKYLSTADVLAIRDSVKALVSTVLHDGLIVFGGHPAITPLVALLLRGMPAETKRRVVLYQSRFFERDFLDENDEFIDLRLTPAVPNDRDESLAIMRQRMIQSEPFDAAIFIGGMEGIWSEYRAFHEAHPSALCFPIASTGAAALELYREIARDRRDLIHELTYPTLFRNLLKEIEEALCSLDVGALLTLGPLESGTTLCLHSLTNNAAVGGGDVIRVHPSGQVNVLYRRGANSNALFITERCNSCCLMCSQPPRDEDDEWRIPEIVSMLRLIDRGIPVLGVTGGEPTLLGSKLNELFAVARDALPDTNLHVLTNGRRFSDPGFTRIFDIAQGQVIWAIPLYADISAQHDYVVQARGAFDETMRGLHNLAEVGHRVEIRCVLHQQSVGRLLPLSEFIYRNLPFVEHVAFMGLEPMGYARRNRDLLWVDPLDYQETLEAAVDHLADREMTVSIYNLPLCVLKQRLWSFARQSISDWKNIYLSECDNCCARANCGGFFRSTGPEWRSRGIHSLGQRGSPQ